MSKERYKIMNLETGQEYDTKHYGSKLQIVDEIRLCNACGMSLALVSNHSMRRRIDRIKHKQ